MTLLSPRLKPWSNVDTNEMHYGSPKKSIRDHSISAYTDPNVLVAHSVTTPALLCRKEPAQGTQSPLLGALGRNAPY